MRPCQIRFVSVVLSIVLVSANIFAGISVTSGDGITITGADGVVFNNPSGWMLTNVDSLLSLGPNGISTNGLNLLGMSGVQTINGNAADGVNDNQLDLVQPSGITITGADGITITGADGVNVTAADGTIYQVNSLVARQPTGITITGADGISITGLDGYQNAGPNGITITGADGLVGTNVNGITITGADGITVTGADGTQRTISPNNVTINGPDGITITGADGITIAAFGQQLLSGIDMLNGVVNVLGSGLQSLDPNLAVQLNRLTDDSNINAVVVYHSLPGDSDIADLRNLGVLGGTRYKVLPMVVVSTTKQQLIAISHLPNVRSIYGTRTLQSNEDPNMALNNSGPVYSDSDLNAHNSGSALSGKGVTVAVLDTGVDATHQDLSGRVVQNVKLADLQGTPAGFLPPVDLEGLADTDLVDGHGTFVAGIIAGSGVDSAGKFSGVAPGAQILGLSAGDIDLTYVLAGFDYLLEKGGQYNVRVVNCSFSADTVFDFNDPVNIATKMLTDSGVSVVFSAGNSGSGAHTLNPYAVAPWVVSVGATDELGRLAAFSSRGDFGSSLFHPTLVAPGVNIASLRAHTSVTGALNLLTGDDTNRLSPAELPFYTTASGTSFSAPQVAATIALMLEADPGLTPSKVKQILSDTATPMPGRYGFEVGAGMLNAHGAVVASAFQRRRTGTWRTVLSNEPVSFLTDPGQQFAGTALPLFSQSRTFNVPGNALFASASVGWGSLLSATDLSLSLYDPRGSSSAQSNSPLIPGLTGGRQSVLVSNPVSGSWSARVSGGLGVPQSFQGLTQITRVQYETISDLGNLAPNVRTDILRMIRTFVMTPIGSRFQPAFAVSRGELAQTLVRGGCAPPYLPPNSHYSDIHDSDTSLFVESCQAVSDDPLFYDATVAGEFKPLDNASRLTAAVALVRAAGLRDEADAASSTSLTFADTGSVPAGLRGYVAVAVAHGLLCAANNRFRPAEPLNRSELAHAMAVIATIKMQ